MRLWRKKNPTAAREADRRRTDDRRLLERRARSYVSAYLRRGRIVAPPFCDRCGKRGTLSYYHPDPSERRSLLWLCPADRRAVAAGRFAVVPHWEWPGHVEPLPTAPRWPRFSCDADRIDAALTAVSRLPDLTPGQQREIFVAAFFRGRDLNERTQLFGCGLARLRIGTLADWAPYGISAADDVLRGWVRDELRRWERGRLEAAPRFITDEDRIAERQVIPRFASRPPRRRGRFAAEDAIGYVPRPPAHVELPKVAAAPLDERLLERVDAELVAFDRELDAILARIAGGLQPPRRDDAEEDPPT